jgi:16S rRNA (uracil1498-N3)-methyltransferase
MTLHRFYCPDCGGGEVELGGPESRHAARVLRLGPGSRVLLFDGTGGEFDGEIVETGRVVRVRILGRREGRDLGFAVTAACAVPKGRRLEFMVQKLAELGAARLVPLRFERSVASMSEARRRRCQTVAAEASRQSGRATLMSVEPEVPLARFLEERFELLLAGSPEASERAAAAVRPCASAFVVGPEGGMTRAEIERLAAAGARLVRLGPTLLRVETAAVALMATIAGAHP